VYTGDISEVDLVLRQHCDVKDTLSDKRLRISIDYSNTDISTLNWEKNDENGKIYFELDSINRTFEKDRVKVEEEGKDTDTIVLVGIENIEYLKSFYTKIEKTLIWLLNLSFRIYQKRRHIAVKTLWIAPQRIWQDYFFRNSLNGNTLLLKKFRPYCFMDCRMF